MKLVGLTGGIGSGKSTVASIFRTLGIPIYESDEKAKTLMASNPGIRKKIIELLGPESYAKNDNLNTQWIASKVFTDPHKLEQLNAIVHPVVFDDLKSWAKQHPDSPYLIQESAILFEENLTDRFKAIVLVVANEEERIKRVMTRDNVTREDILKRMNYQWKDDDKIPLSDFIIFNDGERSLIEQVTDIDQMIRAVLTND